MRGPSSSPRLLFAALSLLFCLSSHADPSGGAAVSNPASPSPSDQAASRAPANLQEARARLAKAGGGPDYRSLLSAFASSLRPSDALLLLSESIPVLPQGERYPFLVESGDLSLLLGLFSDAASRYAEASSLAAGGADDRMLLRSARCSLAAGDPEKASSVSAAILAGSPEPALAAAARLVGAWALVAQGRNADARAAAADLAAPPSGVISPNAGSADREGRCEARFLLWLIAPDSASRASLASGLASDFPGSPEALIATGAASAPPLPHWYLGGIGANLVGEGSAGGSAVAAAPAAAAEKPAIAEGAANPPSGPAAASSGRDSAKGKGAPHPRLQLGYFSVEENAEALKDELSSKGFAATVEEKLRGAKGGGQEKRWVVTVEPGSDAAKTVQKLKDSGYEAYVSD